MMSVNSILWGIWIGLGINVLEDLISNRTGN